MCAREHITPRTTAIKGSFQYDLAAIDSAQGSRNALLLLIIPEIFLSNSVNLPVSIS